MSRSRTRGEGSIRQRPNGLWEVRITLNVDFESGAPKRISRYAHTHEEAVRILHELSFMNEHNPSSFNPVKTL